MSQGQGPGPPETNLKHHKQASTKPKPPEETSTLCQKPLAKEEKQQTEEKEPPLSGAFDRVTAVAWTSSGQHFALGTPGGLLLYCTDAALTGIGVSLGPKQPQEARTTTQKKDKKDTPEKQQKSAPMDLSGWPVVQELEEVLRRELPGGVGQLSLHGESSLVGIVGLRTPRQVQLIDLANSNEAALLRAATSFPAPVHALQHGPGCVLVLVKDPAPSSEIFQTHSNDISSCSSSHAVRAASSGDLVRTTHIKKIHRDKKEVKPWRGGCPFVFVFDQHLVQRFLLPVCSQIHPAASLALTAGWSTPCVGAGLSVRRLRGLLPGGKTGQFRVLTLQHTLRVPHLEEEEFAEIKNDSTLTPNYHHNSINSKNTNPTHPNDNNDGSNSHGSTSNSSTSTSHGNTSTGEVRFWLVEVTPQTGPLRALALSSDGRFGVSLAHGAASLRLFEFRDVQLVIEVARFGLSPEEEDATQTVPNRDSHAKPPTHAEGVVVSLDVVSLQHAETRHAQAEVGTRAEGEEGRNAPASRALVVCVLKGALFYVFLSAAPGQPLQQLREAALTTGPPAKFALRLPTLAARPDRAGIFLLQWRSAEPEAAPHARNAIQETKQRLAAKLTRPGSKLQVRLVVFDLGIEHGPSVGANAGKGLTCTHSDNFYVF